MSQGENPFADDLNPYRASSMDATTVPHEVGGVEAIRREHIAHEASVKSIGTLYSIGFVFMLLGFVAMIITAASARIPPDEQVGLIITATLFLLFGVFQGVVGWGLRGLKTWARWIGVVLSGIGLLGIPVGTLISIYFLYLLLSPKANVVFSPEYQHIIAQTPHVKYKTPWVAWVALGILAVLLVLGVGLAIFAMPV